MRGLGGERSDLLVLCYHAVSERWPAALSVTPGAFRRQVSSLLDAGYRPLTFTDALDGQHDERVLAITFDDGWRSVPELAFPILGELGAPATVFVPTSLLGANPMSWPGTDGWLGTEHEHELASLTWDDARTLVAAGWEIGSHAQTHPYLTRLDDATLEAELAGSRARCEEELGVPCTSLAYPYGDHDARVLAAALRAGYRYACTVPRRIPEPEPLAWPRVGIWHTDGDLAVRAKVSPTVRRLRRSRAWTAVDGPRLALKRALVGRGGA